ncbi:MAG TPA: NAD(P)-binding domain-containing protein, partial [Acidimicrobiales bacterium]|nr:NAD(P)-binding domain-containing protein [Acidimicrobiales bacterium]
RTRAHRADRPRSPTAARPAGGRAELGFPIGSLPEEVAVRIGIIGAGNIGGNLTRRFVELGHEVRIANSRGPETLRDLAAETGATPVVAAEAGSGADFLVVTVPEFRVPDLPEGLTDGLVPGAPLVDTGNYYPRRDGRIDDIEAGTTESRWVERQLGYPVVKAFNTMYAQHLLDRQRPPGAPDRLALPVAGDDPAAKDAVMRLVDELGFDPVDAGGLDESWRQQPGTPVYVTDLDAAGVRAALAAASPERPAGFRG